MITKNYIKMCEKAEEIQKAWKPEKGDLYAVIVHGKPMEIVDIYIDGFPLLPEKFSPLSALYIWLPTQEQLQEILWQDLDEYEYWISKLHDFILDLPFEEMTMNELWLAFVMHEKYNKVWNGKDWVKE